MFTTTLRNLILNTDAYMAVLIDGIPLECKANFINLQYGGLHYGVLVPGNLVAPPGAAPSPALLSIFPITATATSSLARCAKLALKKQGPVTHDLAVFIFVIEINLLGLGP